MTNWKLISDSFWEVERCELTTAQLAQLDEHPSAEW